MKTREQVLLLTAITLLITSCIADHVDVTACVVERPDGFLFGLWHGFISPVTFVGSLFIDSVEMYSVNNNGGWYDFGFVLGAGILFGGGSRKVK
jgi:hypothetical protein